MYDNHGIYESAIFTIILMYLYVCLIYTHIKTWQTEPGFPERVATATGALKLNIDK